MICFMIYPSGFSPIPKWYIHPDFPILRWSTLIPRSRDGISTLIPRSRDGIFTRIPPIPRWYIPRIPADIPPDPPDSKMAYYPFEPPDPELFHPTCLPHFRLRLRSFDSPPLRPSETHRVPDSVCRAIPQHPSLRRHRFSAVSAHQ